MATVKASAIPFSSVSSSDDPLLIKQRIFRVRGEGRYSLELEPAGISIEVDRLRRSSQELWGEVTVRVKPETMPSARHIHDGCLSLADFNFSSSNARSTRAKLLERRSATERLDWEGFIEEFCVGVINAERAGKPAVVLADIDVAGDDENAEAWDIGGFPVLQELPMVLFGQGSSGKSYFATWIAGELARQGEVVLYNDWEFSGREHRKRLQRLFQPMPRNIIYAHCDTPLSQQADRLYRLINEHKVTYAVNDSIGFAVDGPAESQEAARTYFAAVRQLGIGTLNIAHIAKAREEGKDPSVFGSVFFQNGARSCWFVDRALSNPPGEIRFGLHHRKNNVGDLLPARGYRLIFDRQTTRIESIDIKSVDELTAQLPALDRIKLALRLGPLSPKALSEELNLPMGSVRSVFSRHASQFVKLGLKFAVREEGADF